LGFKCPLRQLIREIFWLNSRYTNLLQKLADEADSPLERSLLESIFKIAQCFGYEVFVVCCPLDQLDFVSDAVAFLFGGLVLVGKLVRFPKETVGKFNGSFLLGDGEAVFQLLGQLGDPLIDLAKIRF